MCEEKFIHYFTKKKKYLKTIDSAKCSHTNFDCTFGCILLNNNKYIHQNCDIYQSRVGFVKFEMSITFSPHIISCTHCTYMYIPVYPYTPIHSPLYNINWNTRLTIEKVFFLNIRNGKNGRCFVDKIQHTRKY